MEKGWYREGGAKNPIDQDIKRPVAMSPNWDSAKFNKIIFMAYLTYYFRPSYILQRMLALKSMAQLVNSFKGMMTLFRWVLIKLTKKDG